MLKRLAALASAFALVAGSAAAEPTCKSEPDLSWLLAPLAEPSATALDSPEALVLAERGADHLRCYAEANCYPHANVSCSYSGSTCVAVDRSCPGQRGYVTCNGVTTYCPICPTTSCTEGALRYLWTGYCCWEGGKEKLQQQCQGGEWVYTGEFICQGPCGPIDP